MNKKVMSLSIDPKLHEEVKRFSNLKGKSTSEYICNLIEQAVKLSPEDDAVVIGKASDDSVKQVVLKIPVALRANAEKLRSWLEIQVNGIVKVMTKVEEPKPESE